MSMWATFMNIWWETTLCYGSMLFDNDLFYKENCSSSLLSSFCVSAGLLLYQREGGTGVSRPWMSWQWIRTPRRVVQTKTSELSAKSFIQASAALYSLLFKEVRRVRRSTFPSQPSAEGYPFVTLLLWREERVEKRCCNRTASGITIFTSDGCFSTSSHSPPMRSCEEACHV